MANHDAGNTLQRAIAEGRARQCTAMCKATGERCQRVARDGYDVCSVHGAGTAIREEDGTRRPPGRPVEHGLYSQSLSEEEMDLYDQAFGDLTLVHEAALSKVKLAQFVRKMADDLASAAADMEANEDEGGVTVEVAGRQPRQNAKEKEYYFIRLLESTVKTVNAAYDQLRDKKIVVALQGDESEIMEKVQTAVTKEMAFINGQLCPECRRRILEAVRERQQTIIE
ncbi:MAG: hypothetical protein WC479_06865 [Candidatus Izemoplasmatales bacterium]|jgi:hypothetical protein